MIRQIFDGHCFSVRSIDNTDGTVRKNATNETVVLSVIKLRFIFHTANKLIMCQIVFHSDCKVQVGEYLCQPFCKTVTHKWQTYLNSHKNNISWE